MLCPAGTLKKHARQLQTGEINALPPPGVDGAGPALAPTGAGAAAIADELMSQLRRAHCALVSVALVLVLVLREREREIIQQEAKPRLEISMQTCFFFV